MTKIKLRLLASNWLLWLGVRIAPPQTHAILGMIAPMIAGYQKEIDEGRFYGVLTVEWTRKEQGNPSHTEWYAHDLQDAALATMAKRRDFHVQILERAI